MMMQPQQQVVMAPGQQMAMVPMIPVAPVPSMIPPGTPPGLEFLLATDRIVIQQQIEMLEVFTGINTNNRYAILDTMGRRMYFAAENSDACGILCMGRCRARVINVFNCFGMPVCTGNRKSGCCGGCGNSVIVTSPDGAVLGSVEQNCEVCSASWNINDSAGVKVLRLQAPCCSVCCPSWATCCEAEFPLMSLDGQKVGTIKKHMGGIQELFTNADNFSVTFPMDLDCKLKAVLIFAVFMIDFMYYEEEQESAMSHF